MTSLKSDQKLQWNEKAEGGWRSRGCPATFRALHRCGNAGIFRVLLKRGTQGWMTPPPALTLLPATHLAIISQYSVANSAIMKDELC